MATLFEILVYVFVFIGVTSTSIWWLRKLWITYKNLQISEQFKQNFEVLSNVDAKKSLINREIMRIKVQTANVSLRPLIDTTLRSISLLEDLNDHLEKSEKYENFTKRISFLNDELIEQRKITLKQSKRNDEYLNQIKALKNKEEQYLEKIKTLELKEKNTPSRISTLNDELIEQRKISLNQSKKNDEYLNQIKDLKNKEDQYLEKIKILEHKEKNTPSFQDEFGKFRWRYFDHLKTHDVFYQNGISGITLCKTRFSIEAYIDDSLVMLKTNRSITFFRHEKNFTSRSFNEKINSILHVLELDLHVRQHNYRTSIFFKAGHHLELEDGLEIIL